MDYQSFYYFLFLYILLSLFSFTSSTNFSFPYFPTNDNNVTVRLAATKAEVDGHLSIRLTDNQVGGTIRNATGRAFYNQSIPLWDPNTNITTNFTTSFEFTIRSGDANSNLSSGGIAFFIASEDSLDAPENSFGGWLGLFSESTDGNSSNRMVAVEFDTYQDQWDPSDNHVGINVNSIVSKANRTWNNRLSSGDIYVATVSYDGNTKDLNVMLKGVDVPMVAKQPLNLTFNVNLMDILPEKVIVGFSASTGEAIPLQVIRSWNFSSTLGPVVRPDFFYPAAESVELPISVVVIIGVVLSFFVTAMIIGLIRCVLLRNRRRKELVEEDEDEDEEAGILETMNEVLIEGTGPKRFAYKELVVATGNFSEEGKLGQGGFGGVYRGFLAEQNMEIAVKKVSSSSNQGKKEYVSEVNTISRLRHRNLVQLVGWSQKRDSFLLVYEYMPNGSLDYHLFRKKSHLSWPVRYKIVQGLASGLLYLHEEWEQCVVHRDIKSSNVMLDSNFQAKLGDFGLARLVDHSLGLHTTALAGTMGYMAPECFITSKASKESDVFSFGVVMLEIACGRRVVEHKEEESKISLVNWVWELLGGGTLLDAVDDTLNGEYNEEEMKCLMSVGLWCAHPDHKSRPSIRQAIQVLNFEAPLPSLPSRMPVPMYYSPGETSSTQASSTFSEEGINKSY